MPNHDTTEQAQLLGHPVGLFTLFFAEMWERFSYYGMRALLVFYMIKGFLKYSDGDAYTVYGAYTALVYMTPFFGGMIADRLLGPRRAVVLGGLLMAAGHLTMTIETTYAFYMALALLITGNGFFKPNISTMVGSLYREGSPKRDGGFTIFYMGINLGAAMSPLLCGYIGETYGWHYGFGLATIGMLTGIAVFVAPSLGSQLLMGVTAIVAALNIFVLPRYVITDPSTQVYLNYGMLAFLAVVGVISLAGLSRPLRDATSLSTLLARLIIVAGAFAGAIALVKFGPENIYSLAINYFVAVVLALAGIAAWIALGRGGLPKQAGAAPDVEVLRRSVFGIPVEWMVYLGAVVAVPVLALFVSGFAPFTESERSVMLFSQEWINELQAKGGFNEVAAMMLQETSKPAGLVLFLAGLVAVIYLGINTIRLDRIPRQRMYVAFILTFFAMLFFAFFEQAGSSVTNFTDRNVNRVVGVNRTIASEDVGQTITIQPTQEQLGYSNADGLFTLTQLDTLRNAASDAKENPAFTMEWTVQPDNVGMNITDRAKEIPASWFQAVNPVYILLCGLPLTALWGFLGKRGKDPSTPVKFALGLVQIGLGFGAFWYGAQQADDRGMVALAWLFIGYLLQTTGELCLSPVGLSMVTKLSPSFLVSTVMGTWFLATAFSQFLAAIIAQFTGVHETSEVSGVPAPSETVHLYGDVFGKIALTAMASGVICLLLAPILKKWMHEGVVVNDDDNASRSRLTHH